MVLSRRGFLKLSVASVMPQVDARTIGIVPFEGSPAVPLGRLVGRGLDARLFSDLSVLGPLVP